MARFVGVETCWSPLRFEDANGEAKGVLASMSSIFSTVRASAMLSSEQAVSTDSVRRRFARIGVESASSSARFELIMTSSLLRFGAGGAFSLSASEA